MSTPPPDISIVCCTYNREAFVRRHYEMLRERMTPSCEVLYTLDHCTDGTLAYVEGIAATDRRVRFVENSGPQGLFNSRNFAINHARGKYIHYLDDDDAVSSGFYTEIDKSIRSEEDGDMILTDMVLDREGEAPRRLKIVGEGCGPARNEDGTSIFEGDLFDHILHGRLYFNSANALIKRSLLQSHPFRADIRKSSDWLLYLELSHSRPLRLVYRPAVHAIYWVHAASMSVGADKSYWNMKAFEALHEKVPSAHPHAPAVRATFAKSLFDAGYAVRREDKRAAARYYWRSARLGLVLPSAMAIAKLALLR